MSKWSRGDVIGCVSLIVAVLAIMTAFFEDELRCYLLEKCSIEQAPQPYPTIPSIDSVELNSDKDVDYTTLRDLLKAQEWKEADQETWSVMLQASGPEAVDRGYLFASEVEGLACNDLRTIDQLWLAASGGKFGFSVQKDIYVEAGNPLDGEYHSETWTPFAEAVGWEMEGKRIGYENVIFSTSAPKGHLPLTMLRFDYGKYLRRIWWLSLLSRRDLSTVACEGSSR